MKLKIKNLVCPLIISGFVLFFANSCKKNEDNYNNTNNNFSTENYSSVENFKAANSAPMQIYTVDASTGGSFATPKGTVITVPKNAFITKYGSLVTGSVTIKFKDIYKRSDMLFNDLSTNMCAGGPIKSAGMFYIKAIQGTQALQMAWGKKISVQQPLNGWGVDNNMKPLRLIKNDTANFNGWAPAQTDTLGLPYDSLCWSTSNYIFSLYQFNNPVDSGSWCNSDNPTYFSAYQLTSLILHPLDDPHDYSTEMFLVFGNVNSMVHVYYDGTNFPYVYAPLGLSCTAVAIGAKNGKLYSSFTPITIGSNTTVNFSLSETTDVDFKTQLDAIK